MARHRNQAWWSRWPFVLAAVVVVAVGVTYVGVGVLHTGRAAVDCPGGSRTVTVGVDPSAQDWVGDLAGEYNAEHRQVSGLCAQLAVSPLPLDKALLAAPADALAAIRSPQGTELQFSDYLNLARDPRGWGRVGKPGWGPVRFSSADPHGSETGVSLIQAVATTSAGVPLDQTTARTFGDTNALAGLLSFVHVLGRTTNDPNQLFDAARDMSSATAIIKAFGLIVATE